MSTDEIIHLIRKEQGKFVGRTQQKKYVGYVPFPNDDLPEKERATLVNTIPDDARRRMRYELKDTYCGKEDAGEKANLTITSLCNKVKYISEEHKLAD